MPLLKIDQLSFAYKIYDEKSAYFAPNTLEDINLEMNEGEKILIVAEPKNGKTTLTHLITGFAPYYEKGKVNGSILIDNEKITKPLKLSGIVSLIEQNSQDQILCTTCENEIAFYLEQKCYPYPKIKEIVDREINNWNLEPLRISNPTELSGGERKRLTLAAAFATDSKLFILDESFDELDSRFQNELANVIKKTNKAIIATSSRYREIFNGIFDKVYELKDKKLIPYISKELTMDKINSKSNQEIVLQVKDLVIDRYKTSDSSSHFHLELDNLILRKQEVIGLIGANGSGKTTLASSLCNLISIQKGNIITKKNNIGYVMQNPDYQLFNSTCEKELDLTLKYLNYSKEEKEELKEYCYKNFNFKPSSNPFLLDQGARKFLQLAINYLLDREIYILDEIDSSLSLNQVALAINILLAKGSSIILISHDDFVINKVCNRIYKIEDNKVVQL